MEADGQDMTLGRDKVWCGLFISGRNGIWVGFGWRAHSKGKAHCKKLKQDRWFLFGDSMRIKNRAIPQHHVRYSQIRQGALGIPQYTNRIREIIPVRRERHRNN